MAEQFQIPQFKDKADFQAWWKRPEIEAFFKRYPDKLSVLIEHPSVKPYVDIILGLSSTDSPESVPPHQSSPLGGEGRVRGQTFGKYTIEKKLGQGGMGAVYLANDPALGRRVALKIITSDNKEMLERFHLEAQAVSKLRHPNIVQVYEAGVIPLPSATGGSALDNRHYFTMDYIDGMPLNKLLEGKNKLSLQNVAKAVFQIASALHYAHSQQLVHRDIKPANILIDKTGKAFLTDFGVAKQLTGLNRSLTMTGQTVGTPNYMSPEQAMGLKNKIDHRSDIFSLGATLYHCITGRVPFSGKEVYEVFSRVVNTDPISPTMIVKTIPKDLETICLKCMEKEIANRYQTASELAQDIKRYLAGEAIAGRRSSWLERFWYKVRRNKVASLGIAGGAAVLIAGLIISHLVSSSATGRKIEEYRKEAKGYFKEGKYAEAKSACEKAMEMAQNDADINALYEKSLAALEKKDTETKKTQAQIELRTKAKTVLDRTIGSANPDDRIRAATEALSIDPNYGDAYLFLGYAYKDKKNYDKAYEYFSKAIEATPTLAHAYYERAKINDEIRGNPEEALSDFRKVLKYDPESYVGYFAKGKIEEKQKKYDEAIESYNKAIELYPDYAWAYVNRGLTYHKKGKFDRAIEDYTEGIRLDPQDALAYSNRGAAYYNTGELDRAIDDLNTSIGLNPKSADAYNNRGLVYWNKAESLKSKLRPDEYRVLIDKALNDYTEVIKLSPKFAGAYTGRGTAYFNKGEIDLAISDYNTAIQLDPKEASAYKNRAIAGVSKKDYRKAQADFERFLELAPDDPQTTQVRKVIEDLKKQIGK
jgi:serine/threonine-protein kinase